MKFCLIVLAISIQCILQVSSFKLIDSDSLLNDHFIQYKKASSQYADTYANKQADLFDLEDNDESYQRTLAALAQAAASKNNDYQFDPSEVSSEEIIDSDDNRYNEDEIRAELRDEETESHSSLGSGHQYVSGGAGEGKQHLQPDGSVLNKEEVKSDEDLPAYCDPPNPCPIGYSGDDCDSRPYEEYTAEFSKNYQEQQNCMCDDDHNECKRTIRSKSNDKMADLIKEIQQAKLDDRFSGVVAKKSPRNRRDTNQINKTRFNPYFHKSAAIRMHVAKKSVPI